MMRALLMLILSVSVAMAQSGLRSPAYLSLLSPAPAVGFDSIFSDVFIDWETGSDNTVVTTTIGTNSAHGVNVGNWELSGAITGMKISTLAEHGLPTPVIALDVIYSDAGATRGILMTNGVDSEWMGKAFGVNKSRVIVSFWIFQTFAGGAVSMNHIDIQGGGSFASLSTGDSGSPYYSVETDAGDGAHLAVTNANWYRGVLEYVQNSFGTLYLYGASGGLIGVSSNSIPNNPCTKVRFGRVDAHSASHPATYAYLDDIIIRSETVYLPIGAADTNAWFPTITLLSSNSPISTNASISWSTMDAYGTSEVDYGATSSYGTTTTNALGTNHQVTLLSLTAGNTYHFRARTTASGKTTESSDYTFTTPANVYTNFVWVSQNSTERDASTTTVATNLTGVTAGQLIVAWVKHEGTRTNITVSDGTTTFTAGTKTTHSNNDCHGQFFYLLSSVASGTVTYTATFDAARTFKRILVKNFNYSGTVALDTQATNSATSANPSSGNITTTGAYHLALAGYGEYSGNALSSPLINGFAVDHTLVTANKSGMWDQKTNVTYTGGFAVTMSSAAWVCNIIAFK